MRRKPRIRMLKIRLIISIFAVITVSYGLVAVIMMLAYHGGAFSFDNIYETGQFWMRWLLTIFFLISVVIGLLIFNRFNQLFLQPVNELSEAFVEVEKGNYEVTVSTHVKICELYHLTNGFNQMMKELSSVELLKKDFISYFSHEFKTPIASIQGFSRQIKEQNLDSEKQQEYADIIYRESDRLIKMSENVLTLTKFEHQTTLTDIKTFSLDEQLRRTLLVLEKQWSEKDLNLVLDLKELEINSNEEMVKQIWINVLSNAINYSEPGAILKVQCRRDGDFAKVRIRDYGVGMPDKVRKRIFEKFYQGDTSHGSSGNGLGMSIVKRIIDLCDGKIIIKSQLQKGTVVIVYLPMNEI